MWAAGDHSSRKAAMGHGCRPLCGQYAGYQAHEGHACNGGGEGGGEEPEEAGQRGHQSFAERPSRISVLRTKKLSTSGQ